MCCDVRKERDCCVSFYSGQFSVAFLGGYTSQSIELFLLFFTLFPSLLAAKELDFELLFDLRVRRFLFLFYREGSCDGERQRSLGGLK